MTMQGIDIWVRRMVATALGLMLYSGTSLALPPPANTLVSLQAYAEYTPDNAVSPARGYSNYVQFLISPAESITLSGSPHVGAGPGDKVTLPYLLANTGNVHTDVTLVAANGGSGCAADDFDLTSLVLFVDGNNNGVADPAETVTAPIHLATGEKVSILLTGNVPLSPTGEACLSLVATTGLQNFSAQANTTVGLDGGAVVTVSKTAAYSGYLIPGVSKIDYTVRMQNTGTAAATAASTDGAATPSNFTINGTPVSMLLLRDPINPESSYVYGSLSSSAPGAIRLFRLQTDPPFHYRTGEDASAIEVAIGLKSLALVPGGSMEMTFRTRLLETATSQPTFTSNQSFAHYRNGTTDTSSASNMVVLPIFNDRIGIALAAGDTVQNFSAPGVPDGTATVRMSLLVRNYGKIPLENLQIEQLLAGSGDQRFGIRTASAVPKEGEYTVVASSLTVSGVNNSAVVSVPDPDYDGTSAHPTLLTPGGYLPVNGEFTVSFDLRFHIASRPAVTTTQARANARAGTTGPSIEDLSHNGINPDPNDSGPQNHADRTPVSLPAALVIEKKVLKLKHLGVGHNEITYQISVTNQGAGPAKHVRVIDNLGCNFGPSGSTWSFSGSPLATKGLLTISAAFTGNVACNAVQLDAVTGMPINPELSLTDGTRALPAGETEVIEFKVEVMTPPGFAKVSNRAWAGATGDKANILASAATLLDTILVDPQGIVYDSRSRLPVAGAVVKLKRTNTCSVGSTGPILPTEVFNGASPGFSYHPDGSVSMTTDATGEYQFFWMSPPLASICTYEISVTPPPGYALSSLIPAQPGVFNTCGGVVSQIGAPQAGDPTTWFNRIDSGFNPGPSFSCEVVNNHIPLDPSSAAGQLFLEKEGSKKIAEIGDFVDFQLTLTNRTGVALTGVRIDDTLPPGFAYVKGSARLAGKPSADPAGAPGPALGFDFPAFSLAASGKMVVHYRVRIGVGAPNDGDAINRATATSGSLASNQAAFKLHVQGGAFSDDGYLFGKVHLDCNGNGEQDPGDLGIPGVRLLLETGVSVITDAEGRWSLFGVKPITHVLKVDTSTLPTGAVLRDWDNRNAGDPASRFIDLKKGEFAKSNVLLECSDAVTQQVQARREAYAGKPDAELDAAVNTKLATTPAPQLPASFGKPVAGGEGTTAGRGGAALIDLPGKLSAATPAGTTAVALTPVAPAAPALPRAANPGAARAGGADLLGPLAAPGLVAMETQLPQLSGEPGFIDFRDGDKVAANVVNVRVKGPLGYALRLAVNGKSIDGRRVGKKSSLESRGVSAWEYIGIELSPGENQLELAVYDLAGQPAGTQRVRVIAPGDLGVLRFEFPAVMRADPLSPVEVVLQLTDRQGMPITARTEVTLEADRGRWLADDLSTAEPGVQVFVTDGRGVFRLQPPVEPGPARLRATARQVVEERVVQFMPEQREMVGVGIVEGVIDFSRRGALKLGQAPAGNAFEHELRSLVSEQGDTRAAARTAFYFKGTVRGDYLLTTAYDSDRQLHDRLYRDIKPDEYYPVYGDGSVRSADAQSAGKLYVRIDKNRSYLLVGDFTTASSEEVRQISQISRTLTGIKHQYETDQLRITSFASRDTTRQQVEEIRAGGVSFYFLSGRGDIVPGSEKVEVLVRSRSQPQIVIGSRLLARNVDYTFEPLTRRLLLVDPLSSLDADFNPQSIRVSVEIDGGGPQHTVAGTDLQMRITPNLQLGAVVSRDENPENNRALDAVTALTRLGEHSVVAAEAVATRSDEKGNGQGARVEIRHDDGPLKAQAQFLRLDKHFDNPGATGAPGRTEITARAEYTLAEDLRMRGEAIYSRDENDAGNQSAERTSASIALQKKFSPSVVGEVGIRHGTSQGANAGGFDYGQITGQGSNPSGNTNSTTALPSGGGAENATAVNSRITLRPQQFPRLEIYGEAQQDIEESERRQAALGGSYGISDKLRAYARHEYLSDRALDATLGAAEKRNTTVLGLDSAFMEGGRAYDEARFNGAGGQHASGVRQTYKLNERWTLNGSLERTTNFGGGNGKESLAGAFAVQYIDGPWRGNSAIELRRQEDADSGLFSLAGAYKMDRDWTALARSILTLDNSATAGRHLISRQQIGLAWRPAERDTLNALARYEYRYETLAAGADGTTPSRFNTGGMALPGDYVTHVFTGVGNYNPQRGLALTGRYAAKFNQASDGVDARYWAHMLQGRVTWDINQDWDIGAQAGVMAGRGGAVQSLAGLELGYQVMPNVWLSGGYNFTGLREPDLTGEDMTSQGLFFRLRFKFDERSLGFSAKNPSQPTQPAGQTP